MHWYLTDISLLLSKHWHQCFTLPVGVFTSWLQTRPPGPKGEFTTLHRWRKMWPPCFQLSLHPSISTFLHNNWMTDQWKWWTDPWHSVLSILSSSICSGLDWEFQYQVLAVSWYVAVCLFDNSWTSAPSHDQSDVWGHHKFYQKLPK